MKIDDSTIFALFEELLASGERVKCNFGGRSMLPTLSGSDTVVFEPLRGEPHEGDVLMFRLGDRVIVHRLIGREGDTYILQGDNNYGVERVKREGLLGRLVSVTRDDGTVIKTDSEAWQKLSRRSLRRKRVKNFVLRWMGRLGRRQLRPWYFLGLAILMWAPLNGLGVPLDEYVLGLRFDHLLHASVFIPCSLFLMDLFAVGNRKRNVTVWLTAVGVGILTETVQWLLPYRGFDINDMIANFLGVSLGWITILMAKRIIKNKTR